MMSLTTTRVVCRQRAASYFALSKPKSSFYSSDSKTDEPKDIDSHYYKWRRPWIEADGYTPSKISLFFPTGASTNFLKIMQKKYDFSPKGFINWVEKMKLSREKFRQRYIPERHKILGPDLATAHFVVFRGGSVRFRNGKKWIKEDEDGNMDLPSKFVKDLYLEAVDASEMNLMYDALDNLVFLDHLKWLSFANNKYVDDWFLDKISGEFKALEYLSISGCKNVTHRGIAILHRLENLKVLHVENVSTDIEFKLACLTLQETRPHLEIYGLDLSEAEIAESK